MVLLVPLPGNTRSLEAVINFNQTWPLKLLVFVPSSPLVASLPDLKTMFTRHNWT